MLVRACRDPKDDKFPAPAAAGRADVIVRSDARPLLSCALGAVSRFYRQQSFRSLCEHDERNRLARRQFRCAGVRIVDLSGCHATDVALADVIGTARKGRRIAVMQTEQSATKTGSTKEIDFSDDEIHVIVPAALDVGGTARAN